MRFRSARFLRRLAIVVGVSGASLVPLAGATSPPGSPSPKNAAPATAAAATSTSAFSAAVISNGTVELGVNPEGDLDGAGVGDLFVPTGGDALIPGCLCEGWGVADLTGGVSGWAAADVPNNGGVSSNLSVVRFDTTASTAVSEVQIGSTFDVVQDYHPSSTPNLFEDSVTVKNTSSGSVSVRYRRVMDWDVPPTEFNEYVTVAGSSPALAFSSDDGFAPANPLAGPSSILATGTFTNSGPTDHGALFDFDLGTLSPGQSTSFQVYYGATADESTALSALNNVGAAVYSLGKPGTADGLSSGTPNTFAFGFRMGSNVISVDADQQTVTGGGGAATISEIPFGDDVQTTAASSSQSLPPFQLTLGTDEATKQLSDGSVEIYKSSVGAAAAAATSTYVEVDDTSPDPTVSDSELSSVLSAGPSALLDDSDPDNPPPPPDATNVDPTYDGGDATPVYPDGMTLIQNATDATGDDVVAVIGAPQAMDANGNAVSASLSIDSTTNRVIVQVDPNAAFPVHVDTTVGFNEVYTPDPVAAAGSAAATSCANMGRILVWDPSGPSRLAPSLIRYPATCMHYFISVEGLLSTKKHSFDLNRAPNIRSYGTDPKVQAAGSQFHAVAVFNTKLWGVDDLKGGSASQQQKDLKTVCTYAVKFRKRMNTTFNGGPDFRVSSDPAIQGDTWVIDEGKQGALSDAWTRQKLMQLITCLSNGLNNVYPATKGFVFFQIEWPNFYPLASSSYKSGWETLLLNPSNSIVTSSFSSHPFWTWLRPRILGWVEEVYADCHLDQCTGPSKSTTGDSLTTMARNINWYLQHPARLAFSSTSRASQEAKTTLWQKYIPLENAFYGNSGLDNYNTNLPLVTMDRFVRLQIYATRSWATATANGQYPFRKIGFAWDNNAGGNSSLLPRVPLLAKEFAHSLQGAYGYGGTARLACTSAAHPSVSGVPNIGLCKPHDDLASLKSSWNGFGSGW